MGNRTSYQNATKIRQSKIIKENWAKPSAEFFSERAAFLIAVYERACDRFTTSNTIKLNQFISRVLFDRQRQ